MSPILTRLTEEIAKRDEETRPERERRDAEISAQIRADNIRDFAAFCAQYGIALTSDEAAETLDAGLGQLTIRFHFWQDAQRWAGITRAELRKQNSALEREAMPTRRAP